MSKILFSILFGLTVFIIVSANTASAQGMMGRYYNNNSNNNDSTSSSQPDQDQLKGQDIWNKLQNKQLSCSSLTDDDFDVLGDYFMGNMMCSSHETMDNFMTQRLGENGDRQMHIAMGERLSGCNSNAAWPDKTNNAQNGFWPMTAMMGGAFPMMGYYGGFGSGLGLLGTLTWLLLIAFLVLGIIYFLKGILKKK